MPSNFVLSNREADWKYVLPYIQKTAHFYYHTEEALPVFPQNIRPAERQDVTAKKAWLLLSHFAVAYYMCGDSEPVHGCWGPF